MLLRGRGEEVRRASEANDLIEAASAAGARFSLDGEPFYSLSVMAVLPGMTMDDALAEEPLRHVPRFYRTTAGAMYVNGFKVWATFQRRKNHFDVQLREPSRAQVLRFLASVGQPLDNPHYGQTGGGR